MPNEGDELESLTDEELQLRIELARRERLRKTALATKPPDAEQIPSAPVLFVPNPAKGGVRKPRVRRVAPPLPDGRTKGAPPIQIDPKWFGMKRVCTNCGKTKNIGTDFGVVRRRGVESPQSWCRDCRAKTDYRRLERVKPKPPKQPKKK